MKHLFFDLDSTLVDSSKGILYCFTETFTELDMDIPDLETLQTFIGPPLEASFGLYGDEAFVEKAVTLYRKHYTQTGVYQAQLYDGIVEALEELRDRGVGLSIATSKHEPAAIDMLDNLGITPLFNGIFGSLGNDTKADVLRRGLLATNSTASEAVMIGDTHFDMIGGKTVGTSTVGVTWGFGSPQSLRESGADILIDHPSQLKKALGFS